MTTPDQNNNQHDLPPLVINADKAPLHRKQSMSARERLNATGNAIATAPFKTPKRRFAGGALVVIALLSGLALWWTSRVTKPDAIEDPLDNVVGFALLEAEFNNMSVNERLDMIAEIAKRLGDMDSESAGLLAAFAAGINGPEAREQLEENIARLIGDLFEEVSRDYANVQPEERQDLAEDSYVEMVRKFSRLDGNPDTRSDEEILQEGKGWAERDQDRAGRNPWGNQTGFAGRMFAMSREEIGERQSPQAAQRFWMMMGDVTSMLRGEDVVTGEKLENETPTDPQPIE